MAARDRFGGLGFEPAATPLQRYIQNACDPQNFEPNLALNLEITDMINSKKGNAPREAAIAIVNYVNHRNPNVSMLALTLLDICVKNCGYPFHLQISTKEFLNELVRRFPERPSYRVSRVQNKILELIEEWRMTICQTSKYKDDLGFIRDMHRLLSYKGYAFPEVRREDAAVLNPSDNLRSAEEMEAEERAAQSAKLQELIRRGTPHDLQEANKLMRIMAGYDNRHKTDYRAKAADEVGKVQQKARILEEMLQSHRPGDEINEGDVFEELANALASAQPKIQKMCEEESDDHEAVAKLFQINDSIHRTLERYKLVKKGDIEGAAKIPKGTLGTSGAGVSKGANDMLDLIDLDGPKVHEKRDEAQPTEQKPASKGNALEDDLLGLALDDEPVQGGGISLGPSTGSGMAYLNNQNAAQALPSSSKPSSPQPSQQSFQPVKPNYDPFVSLSQPSSKPSTPTPKPPSSMLLAMQQQPARTGSPFQYQQSTQPPPPPSSALLELGSSSSTGPAQDDEWTFSSALPPDHGHATTITNTAVRIDIMASRQGPLIKITLRVSNNTAQLISDFTFQAAVTKGYTLHMDPQSGRTLTPRQNEGIRQEMTLSGAEHGKGGLVKMRWKASYRAGVEQKQEQGELASLGIE